MKSKPVALLLADLGVTKTHSRPHASNDNPYSESQFRTPAMVHYGQTALILQQRQAVLDVAYQIHPERFVRNAPRPPCVPTEVWINKPCGSHEKVTKFRRHVVESRRSAVAYRTGGA